MIFSSVFFRLAHLALQNVNKDYVIFSYFCNFAGVDETNINVFLTDIVEKALRTLNESSCLEFDDDERGLISTTFGRIASYYYLSHLTVQHFNDSLNGELSLEELLIILSDATEFDQLPVRHNEDLLNADLAKKCPLDSSTR